MFDSNYQLNYLVFFFLLLNCVYFIGHLVSCFFQNTEDSVGRSLFLKMLLGLFSIVFTTSLFYSGFNTIHIAFIIPILFYFFNTHFHFHFHFEKKRIVKQLVLLNLFSISVLFFQYHFYSKVGRLHLLPFDMNNHAQISYFMSNLGYESKFAELNSLIGSKVPKRTPYHFTELWLNVSFSKLVSTLKVGYTLIFITYPILYTVYLTGLYMIGQLFIKKSVFLFLLCILGLFIGPLDLTFLREIFFEGHLFSSKTIVFENIGFFFNTLIFSYNGQKHIPFYLLSVLVIYFFVKKDIQKALITISFAPILNIGIMPAVFGAVLLFSFVNYVTTKKNKESFLMFLPTLGVTMFIFIYYHLNGGYDIEKQTELLFLNPTLNFNGVVLKILYRFIYTLLFLVLLYWPVFFFIQRKFWDNHLYLFVFFLLCSGLGTRFVLEGFNSAQFLTVLLPFVNIIVFLILIQQQSKFRLVPFLLFVFIFSINFYNTNYHAQTRRDITVVNKYSEQFVTKVLKSLQSQHQPRIGYLLSRHTRTLNSPGFWYGFYPCEFLFLHDYFHFYSLNFPNHHYSENSTKSNDFSPNHLRYFMSNELTEHAYEKELLSFIRQQHIHFIVSEKDGYLPESVNKTIQDSIQDSLSGDKFYILN